DHYHLGKSKKDHIFKYDPFCKNEKFVTYIILEQNESALCFSLTNYSPSKVTLTRCLSISQRPVPSSPITSNSSKIRRATNSSSTCSSKNHCKKLNVT